MTSPRPTADQVFDDISTRFEELAQQWKSETMFESSFQKRLMHPAYQMIIGMGPAILPLLLSELRDRPAQWFWALRAISQTDPVPRGASFEEAAKAWLDWGREKGLIG